MDPRKVDAQVSDQTAPTRPMEGGGLAPARLG